MCMVLPLFGQVGINTTTPDSSSILDISATDKGILIPRVFLVNISSTQLDGVNTAANGLLIYNTNATTIGGNGIGFYVFNGTNWEKVTTTADSVGGSDADFFEVGQTSPPNSINDDIFTNGNLGINITPIDTRLAIDSPGNHNGLSLSRIIDDYVPNRWNIVNSLTGIYNATQNSFTQNRTASSVNNGSGVSKSFTANYTILENTNVNNTAYVSDIRPSGTIGNDHIGYRANFSNDNEGYRTAFSSFISGNTNSPKTGVYNAISGGAGSHIGLRNGFFSDDSALTYGVYNQYYGDTPSSQYGVYNQFLNDGDGNAIGAYNTIGGNGNGNKSGLLVNISNTGSGAHYGTSTTLSGTNSGPKYGHYVNIPNSAGGNLYGVYASVMRPTGNSYAGYFLGKLAIGSTAANIYTLPLSRGTANQIMQTDATGNVSWVDATSFTDADFFEEGTTTAPNDINDNIFTQGNVAIGKTNPLYALDIVEDTDERAISAQLSGSGGGAKYGSYVLNNNSGSGSHYGYYSILSGAGTGIHYGSFQSITSTGNGAKYGVYSRIQGSGNGFRYGNYQWITSSASSDNTGTYNILDGTGTGSRYGTQNVINSNSSGRIYGTYTSILGSGAERKFGSYNVINPASGGTHFGIYSEATKAGSFAGLFNGRVAIGESSFISGTPDWYILPASRGTNGQVMQTDGSGNVSWVDPSAVSSEDADFFEVGTVTAPNAITDNMYTQGALAIGDTSNDESKLNITAGTSENYNNGLKIDLGSTTSSGVLMRGINLEINSDVSATPTNVSGIEVENNANAAVKAGIISTVTDVGGGSGKWNLYLSTSNQPTSAGNISGIYNTVSVGGGSGTQFGVQQELRDSGGNSSGTLYGYNSDVLNNGSGPSIGFYSLIQSNNNSNAIAFDASHTGNSGSGNKYGLRSIIPASVGGLNHYGVYSEVLRGGANTFAGYFLGDVSIGTTALNNYILPASRGTNGQIMQTDGAGNVSWVNNPSASFWTRTGTTLDVANIADDIQFSSDQTSILFPATTGSPSTMIHLFDSGISNSDRMIFSQSPLFSNWGLMYRDSDDSFRFLRGGLDRVVINLGGGNPLVVNGTAEAIAFQSATTTYPDYVFEHYFKGTSEIAPDYQFRNLSQVEAFLKKNGHLPGVKSYSEILANEMKINFAEVSVANLEKIEELFLYAIEQKKENEILKSRLEKLEAKFSELEKNFSKH